MTSKYDPNRNTLQSKFGFQDEDLKTSKHDEIMLWFDANADKLLLPHFAIKYQDNKRDDLLKRIKDKEFRLEDVSFDIPIPPSKTEPKVHKKIWEYPVMSGNFTVGFIDLLVEYTTPRLTYRGVNHIYNIPLIQNSFEWIIENDLMAIAIEVKSVMPSIGELIRQIRMYQTYVPNISFFVVSPDDRFASALQSQGIGFIKYE